LNGLVGGDFEVHFKSVKDIAFPDYLGIALMYYDQPFRAQVLFWPDSKNVLPTEDGCEVSIQNEALAIT